MRADELVLVIPIVAIVAVTTIKLARMKMEAHAASAVRGAEAGELVAKLDQLEQRMANLETIVLNAEKRREFDRVL